MSSSSLPADAVIEVGLPDGPDATPAEITFRWLARPLALLDDCAARFGDTFTLRFTRFGTHVVVADPDDVQRVFAGSREDLLAGAGNAPLAPVLGRNSLLLLDGPRHTAERAAIHAALRSERLEEYGSTVAETARAAAAAWRDGDTIDLQHAALALSKSVILRAVCGVEGADLERLSGAVGDLMRVVETNAPLDDTSGDGPLALRFNAARDAVHALLDAQIAGRRDRAAAPPADVAAALVDAGLPDDAIRDQLLTLILAGHETTAAAIGWALLALHDAPAASASLHDELASVPPDASAARFAELPYLRATCLETLRLHPPVPVVSRLLRRPLRLRDAVLPAGVFVTPCAHLAHRRAASFAAPLSFQPERFLDRPFAPQVYFPFGGGVRRCLGMGLALLEMQVVLGVWLRSLRFEPVGTVRPLRRAVTIVPGGGWRMRVTAR